MKRIFTTILTFATAMFAFAQNPASTVLTTNFDAAFGGSVNPTGWISANLTTADVVKATAPGYGGSVSAAKIETKTINTLFGLPLPPEIPGVSGIMLSGTIGVVGTTIKVKQGVPYTSKPEGMVYFTKYAPVNTDTAFAYLMLTKWNAALHKTDTIGLTADTISSAITDWTKRIVPIHYLNNVDSPDTMVVLFSSSSRNAAQLGTVLYVDEIIFYPVNTSNLAEESTNVLLVYPNPVSNVLNLKNVDSNVSNIKIFSIDGSKVFDDKILAVSSTLNLASFANGLYYLVGSDVNNNVITKTKFEILK
jgi:Secretion system C-terminal sorting domain